jgi:hypothetical protein
MNQPTSLRDGAESLRQEFPGWWIKHAESGWWIAVRKGIGILRAPTSEELRDLLMRFGAEAQAEAS